MEDVRIGRQSGSGNKLVAVSTADVLLVPYNPHRVALIIAETGGKQAYVRPQQAAASGGGIPVLMTMPPLMLTVQEYGQAVLQEWHAFADSATSLMVIEVLLERE